MRSTSIEFNRISNEDHELNQVHADMPYKGARLPRINQSSTAKDALVLPRASSRSRTARVAMMGTAMAKI